MEQAVPEKGKCLSGSPGLETQSKSGADTAGKSTSKPGIRDAGNQAAQQMLQSGGNGGKQMLDQTSESAGAEWPLQSVGNLETQTALQSDAASATTAGMANVCELEPPFRITLDPEAPWLFTVSGAAGEGEILQSLYGPVSAELRRTYVFRLPNRVEERFRLLPNLLVEPWASAFDKAMDLRRMELDTELDNDFLDIKYALTKFDPDLFDSPLMRGLTDETEDKVITIIERWAYEDFPGKGGRKSRYLDKLFAKLGNYIYDIGTIRTIYTSLYDVIFNHFNHLEKVRALRDERSNFAGDEGMAEPEGFASFMWEDVTSGAAFKRGGHAIAGMAEAGWGAVKGLYHAVRHPIDTFESLIKLPGRLWDLWGHRAELWQAFVNATPEEQARMIGRITGGAEAMLAPFAFKGGPASGVAAETAEQTARATAIVGVTSGGAAIAMPDIAGMLGELGGQLAKLGKGIASASMLEEGRDEIGQSLSEMEGRGTGRGQTIDETTGRPPAKAEPTPADVELQVSVETGDSIEAARAANVPDVLYMDGTVMTRADFPEIVPDQPTAIGRPAPESLPLDQPVGRPITRQPPLRGRPVSQSDLQNVEVAADIRLAESAGGKDFRVNQWQVIEDLLGGTNRPDLSFELNGRRIHIEYDRFPMTRAMEHARRILSNDPDAIVILKGIDYEPRRVRIR